MDNFFTALVIGMIFVGYLALFAKVEKSERDQSECAIRWEYIQPDTVRMVREHPECRPESWNTKEITDEG